MKGVPWRRYFVRTNFGYIYQRACGKRKQLSRSRRRYYLSVRIIHTGNNTPESCLGITYDITSSSAPVDCPVQITALTDHSDNYVVKNNSTMVLAGQMIVVIPICAEFTAQLDEYWRMATSTSWIMTVWSRYLTSNYIKKTLATLMEKFYYGLSTREECRSSV